MLVLWTRSQHQASLPLYHAINHGLRQAVPLVGKDDLIDFPVNVCSAHVRMLLALMSSITQSAARLVA